VKNLLPAEASKPHFELVLKVCPFVSAAPAKPVRL
jgi:hypothetical protein